MKKIKTSLHFFMFTAVITAVCHYFYSWIGFNPTDEGFVLAGSRRILDGEFPHVDFLSLRPLGSSYLHLIDLKLGGDQVFHFSRLLFWLQSAITAWIWIAIANKLVKLDITLPYKYLLATITFIFNVHTFPAMAWTTVDGLFLATLGIFLITHFGKNANQFGYVLIGCAALCKQNFLILIPGIFIIMGNFKRPYYLLDGLMPIIAYAFLIWKNDAIQDSYLQLFARKELLETGVMIYIKSPSLYVGLLLPIIINIFRDKYKGFFKNIDFILVFDLIVLGGIALFFNQYIGAFSFGLFGFLLGYTIVHIRRKGVIIFNALALLLSWTVSISLGYNTPALANGILISALLVINYDRSSFGLKRPIKYALAFTVFIGLLFSFHFARYHFIYKDNPAKQLTANLNDGMIGGKGIKTNDNNVAVLQAIQTLHQQYKEALIIVPDYTAYWVTAPYKNPLNIDWPNRGELSSSYMQEQVKAHLLAKQNDIIIAVQKYRASELHVGLNPIEDEAIQFPIIELVEKHFVRIDETEYFLIYR